jgi:hypothetical protein
MSHTRLLSGELGQKHDVHAACAALVVLNALFSV